MKTAVEWLVEQLKINNYISENAHWLIDEAKELEKQQIIDAYVDGNQSEMRGGKFIKPISEQYYNETFKKL